MHRSWWLSIALVGCYRPAAIDECTAVCGSDPGQTCPPGQVCDEYGKCKLEGMEGNCPPTDAAIDAFEQLDAPADATNSNQICFGTFFKVCVDPQTTDLTLPSTINTNVSGTCTLIQPQAHAPNVCVIVARNIFVASGTTVRLQGQMPIAFFATESIVIEGTVDASSKLFGTKGPGANTGPCPVAGVGAIAAGSGGAGGGAGGALTATGGQGGNGTGGSLGGSTTMRVADADLAWIRGGCPGATGGGAGLNTPGLGGAGGGAVYFMAKMDIEMTAGAIVNASGAAGNGADPRAGGGGGGSGGFIGFHTPLFAVAAGARVFAIGGGGSAGGGGTTKSEPGFEAVGPGPTMMRMGTDGGGNGGAGMPSDGNGGGNGFIASGGSAGGGGGGGGGGAGLVGVVSGTLAPANVAPPTRPLI